MTSDEWYELGRPGEDERQLAAEVDDGMGALRHKYRALLWSAPDQKSEGAMSEKNEAADMSKLTIHQRMIGINSEVNAIGKGGVNEQQRYKFRGIDQVLDGIHPLFAKWGVVLIPRPELADWTLEERTTKQGTLQVHARVMMSWAIMGEGGDTLHVSCPGEALDTSDKATNKAISAALKYMLVNVFTIPLSDLPDADKETIDVGAKKKKVDAKKQEAEDSTNGDMAIDFMNGIGKAKTFEELAGLAKSMKDSGLPEKFMTSLRAEYVKQKERIMSDSTKALAKAASEGLGDTDAVS